MIIAMLDHNHQLITATNEMIHQQPALPLWSTSGGPHDAIHQ